MTDHRLFNIHCRLAHNPLRPNGSHHPARARKAYMSKTADRVLGVHGFVIGLVRLD